MDRLIWTALSGMNDSMVRQRVIASNMANAQTTGFRAEMLYSTPITLTGPALEARAMSEGEVRGADMRPGTITHTGRPLDVAMNGEALLTVEAEDGSEAYTRRGDLSVAPSGVLENGEGRPVLGAAGPITVPPGGSVVIGPDGSVSVENPQNPGEHQVVGRLKLANPAGSKIAKGLDGLFRVTGGGVLPDDEAARLEPQALEQSNVDPAGVIVQMVEAQRLFDIRTKLVSTAREIDERGTALMRISPNA